MVLVAVIVVGGAWFLVEDDDGDNGGNGGATIGEPGPEANGGGGIGQVDLQAAVLTLADVGAEYQPYDSPGSDFAERLERASDCQVLIDLLLDPRPSDAQAEFQRTSDGALVGHALRWQVENDPSIAEIQAAAAECRSVGDGTTTVNFTSTTLDGYGESALAIGLSGYTRTSDGTDAPIAAYSVVWVREGVGSILSVVPGRHPATGVPDLIDTGLAQGLAATADRRLEEVLRD
jgi:hypothetical protein